MTTIFEVSADFGGRDAAQAVLPHFHALKAAMKGRAFEGFPQPKLAFILRVDGEVSTFDFAGLGYPEFKKARYVSLDIGVPRMQWSDRATSDTAAFISGAIASTGSYLKALEDVRLRGTDWDALEVALETLCSDYRAVLHAAEH